MDLHIDVTLLPTQNLESKLLEDMHREAGANALRIVQAKLEKPEDLEKLDQLRTRAIQRKYILDEQLHAAIQSQLESIKTGITELQISLDNTKTVERTMHEVDEKLQETAAIESRLEDLHHEANTYKQLLLTQVNLDHIIQTPGNVKKASEFLEQERLLLAHQVIMEIENSRNYLLFELHEAQDSQLDDLRQLISFRISRWYDCAISVPEKLVTALRIIDREEQVDRFWMNKNELTGFSLPDRPRQWKKLCFELLRKSVKDRIEGNQLETRDENEYWLACHLEMCRRIILRDFKIIIKNCLPCFPKQYDIVNRFLGYYHNCLKEHLTEICDSKRCTEGDSLTTAEVYTIVTFFHDYHGVECLGNPDLQLDISRLSPLLEKDILTAVTDTFLNDQKQKLTEWMANILTLEIKDWSALKEVEYTSEYNYITTLPRTLISMITEMLDMSKQMSNETCQSMLDVILLKINEFQDSYVAEIKNYAERYFVDRYLFREIFTKQMVANANNCESIPNLMFHLRNKYDYEDFEDLLRESHQPLDRYESIGKKFERTAEYCCEIILQEIELDTSEYLQVLFTREWFGSTVKPNCGTIIETTRDYWSSDLTHLKKPLLVYLFYTWHKRILAYYLRNIFSRNLSIKLTGPGERRAWASQLRTEAAMLDREFQTWDGTSTDNKAKYGFDILSSIADILEQTDLDSISFEIASLGRRYSSLTLDQVVQVLLIRGDLTKQEATDKANAVLPNNSNINQDILFEIMIIVNQLNQKTHK